jgi:hypothetical protein
VVIRNVPFKTETAVSLSEIDVSPTTGDALEYASEELRRDREVVQVAVAQDSTGWGWALQHASEELQSELKNEASGEPETIDLT